MKNLIFLVAILFLISCKAQPKSPALQLSKNHQVLFLDSLQATVAITTDEKEHFFSYITKVDMGIQMKKTFAPTITREDVVIEYKNYLKKDVLSFSEEEIELVEKVLREAFDLCNKVSPNIFPKEIKLIQTHAQHYGSGVYYTRENCIVIPKNVFSIKDYDSFLSTILHEISHIYTRYNPKKQKELYALIGFQNMGNPANILIKSPLKERILLNPDGINYAYTINIKDHNDAKLDAIPIIMSNEAEYTPDKPSFFSYLNFSLYRLNIQHAARVVSDSEGRSTLDMNNLPDFHRQITDNTGYIIHPDEIIADNFKFVILRGKKGTLNKKFSDPGIVLLQNVKKILEQ